MAAGDLAAAAETLARQPRVDPDRIGFMGVRQGGWIVPLAVNRSWIVHPGAGHELGASATSWRDIDSRRATLEREAR